MDPPFWSIFFFLTANLPGSFSSAETKKKSLACNAVDKLLYWDMVILSASCCAAASYLVLRIKPLSLSSSQDAAHTHHKRKTGKML